MSLKEVLRLAIILPSNNLRLSIRQNYVSSFAHNARTITSGLFAFNTSWVLESPQDKGTVFVYLHLFLLLFVDELTDWRQRSLVKFDVCTLHSLTIRLSCNNLKPTVLLKLKLKLSSPGVSLCRISSFLD